MKIENVIKYRDYAIICSSILITFANIRFKSELVFDERRILTDNTATACWSPIRSLWSHDFWGWPLSSPASHQSWRPLTSLSYKIENCLLGDATFKPRHLVNLLLHMFISLEFYKFSSRHLKEQKMVLLSSLIFAVHPIQSEAVVSLYGRADLLSTLALISAMKFWACNRTRIAIITAFLGLLAKETGIMIFPVLALQSFTSLFGGSPTNHKKAVEKMILALGCGICLLLLRMAKSNFRSPRFSELDNSFQSLNGLELLINVLCLPLRILTRFLLPTRLCHDWSHGSMDIESFTNPFSLLRLGLSVLAVFSVFKAVQNNVPTREKNINKISKAESDVVSYGKRKMEKSEDCGRISLLLSLLSFPAVSLIARWLLLRYNYDVIIVFNQKSKFISFDVSQTNLRRAQALRIRSKSHFDIFNPQGHQIKNSKNTVFFTCFMLAILYIPMSQIFAFVGFNVAERCLYPLMVPFVTLVTFGLQNVYELLGRRKNMRKILNSICISCLLLLCLKTQYRVINWRNDMVLSESGAKIGSVKSQVNLAVNFAQKNNFSAAKDILYSVLESTNHADIYYNLGFVYQLNNEPEKAALYYRTCLIRRPSHSTCRLNYANLLENSKKSPEFELKKCLENISDFSARGQIDVRSCAFNLSRYYVKIGSLDGALDNILPLALKEAENPTSGYSKKSRASFYNLVADILLRKGELRRVQKWVHLSLAEYDHQPTYESMLRLCLADGGKCNIEKIASKIAHIRLPQILSEFSASRKLRDVLCKVSTENGKLLETCGILSRKDGDFDMAKKFLLAGLSRFLSEPEKFTTYANLGGIFHLEGEKEEAQKFYSNALQIRPNDETIQKNMVLLKK